MGEGRASGRAWFRTYLELLERIHATVRPRTYLEIGVRDGGSLTYALPGTRAIAIDPEPRITAPVPRRTKVFALTSDDYFATRDVAEDLDGLPLDLAFIDGMHVFEFALRDFANIERWSSPGTVVLVHDCYPRDAVTAARERTTDLWSGDVWKLLACLKQHRPDLHIATADVPPTGLAIITGLDRTSTVLRDRYDALVEEFRDRTYESIEADKATALNREDNDWVAIRSHLPARPFRSTNGATLVWMRNMRQPIRYTRASTRRALAKSRLVTAGRSRYARSRSNAA
jgi:hypothetical protein